MKLPPLPEIFGNYVLGDFVEIVSPDSIDWLPQTAGWAWLGIALLVVTCRYGWRRARHWYRNRYRREAIARLQYLSAITTAEFSLAELNKLLKLTALAAFSREQVARLSGEEWIDFLNRHCPSPPFSPELQEVLVTGAYRNTAVDDRTRQHLLAACHTWICDHGNTVHV